MKFYAKTFLIFGAVIGVLFHLVTPQPMPWWPDTFSVGAIFGTIAVIIAVKARTDRESSRRLWTAIKGLAQSVTGSRPANPR